MNAKRPVKTRRPFDPSFARMLTQFATGRRPSAEDLARNGMVIIDEVNTYDAAGNQVGTPVGPEGVHVRFDGFIATSFVLPNPDHLRPCDH